jgi:hypothetical protein
MTSIAVVDFILYSIKAWWLYTIAFLSDMPFRFGKKDGSEVYYMIDNITDKN